MVAAGSAVAGESLVRLVGGDGLLVERDAETGVGGIETPVFEPRRAVDGSTCPPGTWIRTLYADAPTRARET